MPLNILLICSSFFLFISSSWAEPNCEERSFRFLDTGKWVEGKDTFCFGKKKNSFFSEKCRSLDPEGCGVWKLVKKHGVIDSAPSGEVGNPFFFLCHEIGGIPQEIEIKGKPKNKVVSRCTDPASSTFIDLATMMDGLYPR